MKPGNPPSRLSQHKVNDTHTLYSDQTSCHTPTYQAYSDKTFFPTHYGSPRPLNTTHYQNQANNSRNNKNNHPIPASSKPSASNNITMIGVTTRIQPFLSLSIYLKHGSRSNTSLSLITCMSGLLHWVYKEGSKYDWCTSLFSIHTHSETVVFGFQSFLYYSYPTVAFYDRVRVERKGVGGRRGSREKKGQRVIYTLNFGLVLSTVFLCCKLKKSHQGGLRQKKNTGIGRNRKSRIRGGKNSRNSRNSKNPTAELRNSGTLTANWDDRIETIEGLFGCRTHYSEFQNSDWKYYITWIIFN